MGKITRTKPAEAEGVHLRMRQALQAVPSIKDMKALFFKLSRGKPYVSVIDLKTKIVKILDTLTEEDAVAFFKLDGVDDEVKIDKDDFVAFVGEEWIVTDSGVAQMNLTPRLAPAWNPTAGAAIAKANATGVGSELFDERTLAVVEDTAFDMAKEDYAKTEDMEAAEATADKDYTLYDKPTYEEVAISVEQPPMLPDDAAAAPAASEFAGAPAAAEDTKLKSAPKRGGFMSSLVPMPEEGLPLLPPPRTESLEPPPEKTRKFLLNTMLGGPLAIGAVLVLMYCYYNLNI